MKTILSLDPGGTTGWTKAVLDDDKIEYCIGQTRFSENELWIMLNRLQPDYLIYEDFEFRQGARAGLDLTPAHLIGVIRLYLAINGTRGFCQKAAQGKGYFTDDTLKRLGFYHKGVPHGVDSFRHFMQWLTFGYGYQYNTDNLVLSWNCTTIEERMHKV